MFPVYTFEEFPLEAAMLPSIFLVGPTPRDDQTASWRPEALQLLETLGFKGCVFVPENRQGEDLLLDEDMPSAEKWVRQCEWERKGLQSTTVIAAWVPRQLESMPAFTTNVEFGRYVNSGRFLYGRPNGAMKTQYLDWLYSLETGMNPHDNLKSLMTHSFVYSRLRHNGLVETAIKRMQSP
jgi:hypothetical protein